MYHFLGGSGYNELVTSLVIRGASKKIGLDFSSFESTHVIFLEIILSY